MDNDDFTFSSAGFAEKQDRVETQKIVDSIGAIMLENKMENGGGSGQDYSVSRNDRNNDTPMKEEKVGSLSFTVTDMSVRKIANGSTGERLVEDVGGSVKALGSRKTSVTKGAPRKKVPFEIGYSPMDWMRLTRTHPDLAGLNGQSNRRLVTLTEVKQHQTEGSMWTVLNGRVYNIAPYMKFHPGGVDMLMKGVGKDCTSLFNKYHAWVNADMLLEKCLVGILDDSK